mgnify:CR=1 FL=1
MRAKFLCQSITDYGNSQSVDLTAVYSNENNTEDNQFSTATPSGVLKMTITNPDAIGFIKVGKKYYLDFTEEV